MTPGLGGVGLWVTGKCVWIFAGYPRCQMVARDGDGLRCGKQRVNQLAVFVKRNARKAGFGINHRRSNHKWKIKQVRA